MSKVLQIGSLSSVTTSTAIELKTTPFIQGNTAKVLLSSPGADFAGSAKLQGSDDNSTWADISGTTVTAGGAVQVELKLHKYIRLNCTARSAGTIVANLAS
jgi:hypothetical protein